MTLSNKVTVFKSLNFLFLLSYHHILLTHYLIKQIHHEKYTSQKP